MAHCKGAFFNLAHCEGVNFNQALCEGVNFNQAHCEEANFRGAKSLECSQLQEAKDWEKAYRDGYLACGKLIPKR